MASQRSHKDQRPTTREYRQFGAAVRDHDAARKHVPIREDESGAFWLSEARGPEPEDDDEQV